VVKVAAGGEGVPEGIPDELPQLKRRQDNQGTVAIWSQGVFRLAFMALKLQFDANFISKWKNR
jgi:hypothetical protein